jgi:secreted trypsin-like serine protease
VALVRFGVDAAARHVFGSDAADGRWVLTAAWRF